MRYPSATWTAVRAAMASGVAALVMAGCCRPATAEDPSSAWEISLGMPWRSFQPVRIGAGDAAPGRGRFLDGSVRAAGAGMTTYRVHDPLSQVDGPRLDHITTTDVTTARRQEGMDDAIGLHLDLRRTLATRGPWRIGLAGSLRWFRIEEDVLGLGQNISTSFSIYPNSWPSPGPVGGGPDPTVTEAYFLDGGQLLSDTVALGTVAVRHRVRLDLYEITAGAHAAWRHGPLELGLLASPVVALADLDYHCTVGSQTSDSTKETTVLFGARLGAEARWRFAERLFLTLGADYEWFAEELTGGPVRLSLDGLALNTSLGWTF